MDSLTSFMLINDWSDANIPTSCPPMPLRQKDLYLSQVHCIEGKRNVVALDTNAMSALTSCRALYQLGHKTTAAATSQQLAHLKTTTKNGISVIETAVTSSCFILIVDLHLMV